MSAVPAEIAGIGSTAQKLRVSPGFDPMKAGVGPEEYFLLSRIDGTQTLRDVMLATGLPVERAIAIVTRLHSIGAFVSPLDRGPATAPATNRTPTGQVPITRSPTPPPASRTPTGQVPITRSPTPPPQSRAPTSPRVASPTTPPARAPTSPASPLRPPTAPPPFRMPEPLPGTPRTVTRPATNSGRTPSSDIRPPTPAVQRAPTPTGPPPMRIMPATKTGRIPTVVPGQEPLDIKLASPTADELEALGEHNALSDVERRRVLAITRLIAKRDPYAILGVAPGADLKVLKHAYFKLSKEIHPDRFFGKELGSFAERLPAAFEAVARAYARLTTPEQAPTTGTQKAVRGDQPQTPQEYAAELFDRACALEVGGDAMAAMKLFAAAVRLDPQLRFLRRAASCALAANQPRSAVEYAKKAQALAPDAPSSARLLAAAFRAAGKLTDAEEVLVMAMALKNENDSLMAELRNDLAELRRLLNA